MSIDAPEAPSSPPSQAPEPSGGLSFVANAFAILVGLIILALVGVIGVVAVTALVTGDDESAAAPAGPAQINVTLTEFAIDGDLTAPAGPVQLVISNEGSLDHNVAVRGTEIRSQTVGAGGSTLLDLGDLEPGVYELLCEVSGHEAAGMTAELVITGEGGAEVAAGGDAGAMADHEMDAEES